MPSKPSPIEIWSGLTAADQLHAECLAASDILPILQAAQLASELDERTIPFRCMAELFVVRYGRIFSANRLRGSHVRVPDELFTQTFTEEEMTVHRMILKMRNTATAHSDSEFRAIALVPTD